MLTMSRMAGVFAALALAACAGSGASVKPAAPTAASAPEPKAAPAAPAAESPHGHRRPPLELRDGQSGAPLTREALGEKLRAARAIFVGEQHNSPSSHRAQLDVLAQLYGIDHDLGLAVEMLPRRLQPQLDAFLAGSLDEDGFLAAVDWPHTWGFNYALYRPLFEFCRVHGLRIYALNAPRELSKAVNQRGIEGLTPDERALLPTGYPWPTPALHRRFIRQIFDGHPSAPGTDPAAREAAFERFYSAQLIWDESMAQAVTEVLATRTAPARLLVLAGAGHVGPFAIPGRVKRRGVTATLTVGPLERGDEALPKDAEAVDAVVLIDKDTPASPHGQGK